MGIKVGYINILESSTVTVTSAATGYPAYRLYDRMFGKFWQASSTVAQTITVDQGASNILPVDTFVIPANHNLQLAAPYLSWQWSDDNVNWTNIVASWVQADATQIFKQASAPVTHRYLRLYIPAASAAIQAAEVFMTLLQSFSAQCQPAQAGSSFGTERQSLRVRSKSGLVQLIMCGAAARFCNYHLDMVSPADLVILQALDAAWAGNKPFLLVDLFGAAYFVELYANTSTMGTDRGAQFITFGTKQTVYTADLAVIEVLN